MPAPQPAAPPPPRRTGREGAPLAVLSPPVRVCTDYPLLIEQLRNSRRFHVVADADSAHALWSVRPIRDFAALPSGLVRNQFPYEGCLVSKDLLPQTCRRAAAPPLDFPPWYPPCFDLRTEAHLWLAHRRALRSGGGCGPGVGVWVAKLAGGTRSADLCVSASARCLLRHAEAPGGCARPAPHSAAAAQGPHCAPLPAASPQGSGTAAICGAAATAAGRQV